MLHDILNQEQWTTLLSRLVPARQATTVDDTALDLTAAARRVVARLGPNLYAHQARAIALSQSGISVCLATPTASGKTLAFQTAAVDLLSRDPGARVAVFYPLRALARQQEERWGWAVRAALPIPMPVERIDGTAAQDARGHLLRSCRIAVFTPDVVHAWLMSSLDRPEVRSFLGQLKLVIVDEAHSYRGVFGSNAAYLFRRLTYAIHALSGQSPRWFSASATIANAQEHLERLTGSATVVIGANEDTSPRQRLEVMLIEPPAHLDAHTAMGRLLARLARGDQRFLAFVDSRRQVESLAAIAARDGDRQDPEFGDLPAKVLPYRSGYEDTDRRLLERRLAAGDLTGVVSTSALELGLDIGDLEIGLQWGVPLSASTLLQRMGRIGRQRPGAFAVVLAGGPLDQLIRQRPQSLFERPLEPSSVYLDNRRIQYIHAMCLAGPDGEADALGADEDWDPDQGCAPWPPGFSELCRLERQGQVPTDCQPLRAEGGGDPWHMFPLRDVGASLAVVRAPDAFADTMGTITYSQMMREAYPGAVYFYLAQPYRVQHVDFTHRRVRVVPERVYSTRPLAPPPAIWPNVQIPPLYASAYEDMLVIETDFTISESVRGYQERRGSNVVQVEYPNQYWRQKVLRRNFFTSGVAIFHPALADAELAGRVADLLLAALLVEVPMERGDLGSGTNILRRGHAQLSGQRFAAIYDQTYGSLRLSSHLTQVSVLRRCLDTGVRLASEDAADVRARSALTTLRQCAAAPPAGVAWLAAPSEGGACARDLETVIAPGEVGLLVTGDHAEFLVDRVFLRPSGLAYRGRRIGETSSEVVDIVPIANVIPIPGQTRLAHYDRETGEWTLIEGARPGGADGT